jgi:hypothetical protein
MIKQLPFKKEYLPTAVAVVLLLLCYQLAFKNTLLAWQLNSSLKKQLTQVADVSLRPAFEQRKNKNLDRTINLYKADTSALRSKTLSDISAIAEKENVKLTEVPNRDPLFQTPELLIQRIDFEGDYFSLMKVFAALQKAGKIGMIRSATFDVTTALSGNEKVKKIALKTYFEILNK